MYRGPEDYRKLDWWDIMWIAIYWIGIALVAYPAFFG
jgi:hypothetical protein